MDLSVYRDNIIVAYSKGSSICSINPTNEEKKILRKWTNDYICTMEEISGTENPRFSNCKLSFEEKRDIFFKAVFPKIEYDLKQTDAKLLRAKVEDEDNDRSSEILLQRQALRDKIKSIQEASTIEELEAIEI